MQNLYNFTQFQDPDTKKFHTINNVSHFDYLEREQLLVVVSSLTVQLIQLKTKNIDPNII